MVFGWGDSHDAYEQVYQQGGGNEEHKGKFSHELIAGAAAFEGFKAFEDHQRKEGKVVKHEEAKSILAGFAAAEVDKLAETRGADAWDRREDARNQARQSAENMYDDHYINNQGANNYNPNQYSPPERIQRYRNDY